MDFNDVIGQKSIIRQLKDAIQHGTVGHAYMFTGPAGIGKRTLAHAFARHLLCTGGREDAVCGACIPCRMDREGSNPDLYVISPEKGSISVENVRQMQEDIVIRPLYSPRKVYIIEGADSMTVQAQNSLLKTLEEPPGYALILLTLVNSHALLETIRSRVQKINLRKNTPDEIRRLLVNKSGRGIKDIEFIVSYADGIMGTALELADSDEFTVLREKSIDTAATIGSAQPEEIFSLYSFFEENKEKCDIILDIMLYVYRDLLLLRETGNENMLINSDKKDMIVLNVRNFTAQQLLENIRVIEDTRQNIRQNANYQLSIEVMLMRLQEAGG